MAGTKVEDDRTTNDGLCTGSAAVVRIGATATGSPSNILTRTEVLS